MLVRRELLSSTTVVCETSDNPSTFWDRIKFFKALLIIKTAIFTFIWAIFAVMFLALEFSSGEPVGAWTWLGLAGSYFLVMGFDIMTQCTSIKTLEEVQRINEKVINRL